MNSHKLLGRLSLLWALAFAGLVNAAGTISVDAALNNSAKQWFVKHYTPVWENTQSLSSKALAPLYHQQGFMRMGGQLILWQQPASIEQLLQALKQQQWLSAKTLSIQAHTIGPNTQSLDVVWQSDYKNLPAQISCEWYLLETIKQQWKIIGQRYIDC